MNGTGQDRESRAVDLGGDTLNGEFPNEHLPCDDGTNVGGVISSDAVATVGTNRYGYAYDSIGNRIRASANAATNSYAANCLNQYASILCTSAPPRETVPQYDADGNMTHDGRFAYAYDAENRLVSATSAAETNGAIRVLNFYDHRSRLIRKVVQRLPVGVAPPSSPPAETRKWETTETHTFVWDGMNVVLERVAFADGTARTFEYFWGNDLSGTEQSAGGVGGLLAVSLNGVFHIPCYDHNGNVVRYVSETGAIVAQYVYDPYGNVIGQGGPLADTFNFGFSTKYHDRETDLVVYQRRFYSPGLGRWLNRDPIEEEGGVNLYAFCVNNPIHSYDKDGCAYFIKRSMFGVMYQTAQRDVENQEWAHEQLVFEDGKEPRDVGFFGDGKVREDPGWRKRWIWRRVPGRYNDCVMRKAVESVSPKNYQMRGDGHYNCQDYADDLRARYGVLIRDKKVRCECGLSKCGERNECSWLLAYRNCLCWTCHLHD